MMNEEFKEEILEMLNGHEILSIHFEGCIMVKDRQIIQRGEVIVEEVDDEIASILLEEAMIDEFGEGYRNLLEQEFSHKEMKLWHRI